MPELNPDDTLNALADSLRSAGLEGLVSDLLADRLNVATNSIVAEYRAGTLTSDRLWAFVGVLSAFSGIEHDLRRRIQKGVRTMEKLQGNLNA